MGIDRHSYQLIWRNKHGSIRNAFLISFRNQFQQINTGFRHPVSQDRIVSKIIGSRCQCICTASGLLSLLADQLFRLIGISGKISRRNIQPVPLHGKSRQILIVDLHLDFMRRIHPRYVYIQSQRQYLINLLLQCLLQIRFGIKLQTGTGSFQLLGGLLFPFIEISQFQIDIRTGFLPPISFCQFCQLTDNLLIFKSVLHHIHITSRTGYQVSYLCQQGRIPVLSVIKRHQAMIQSQNFALNFGVHPQVPVGRQGKNRSPSQQIEQVIIEITFTERFRNGHGTEILGRCSP